MGRGKRGSIHVSRPQPVLVAASKTDGRERRLKIGGRQRRRTAGTAPNHQIVPVRGQLRGPREVRL